MSQVLRHVIESITPASEAQAEAATALVAPAGAPLLTRVARALGAAQHGRPRAAQKLVIVAIGDHGAGDPGIAMNADHPTVVAARAIDAGTAALAQLARPAPILLVDAGAREPDHLPASTVRLGRGPTRHLAREPAMTVVDAVLGLEAGIALAISVAERGLDVLAIGALGLGSELASAALVAATTGTIVEGDTDAAALAARAAAAPAAGALDRLATYGGSETCVLAGLVLACASMNIPVVLDGYATGTAALAAHALAPASAGYVIAAHRGNFTMPAILAHLKLTPIYDVGLGHGEGTGAAMLFPLIDQAAAFR